MRSLVSGLNHILLCLNIEMNRLHKNIIILVFKTRFLKSNFTYRTIVRNGANVGLRRVNVNVVNWWIFEWNTEKILCNQKAVMELESESPSGRHLAFCRMLKFMPHYTSGSPISVGLLNFWRRYLTSRPSYYSLKIFSMAVLTLASQKLTTSYFYDDQHMWRVSVSK